MLAPLDAAEAVDLMLVAFDLAERWRNPVLVMGDYYLAHTARSVTIPADRDPCPSRSGPSTARRAARARPS